MGLTKRIIRIDKVKVIDDMEIVSYDLVAGGGISSRGFVTASHEERYLILFNRFKIRLSA